jgi:enoyl-CoA hydratase/carnithine racemase
LGDQLGAAYEELADDPDLRVGVLFGHGDHFSAGLDLAQVGPAVQERGHGALTGTHRNDPYDMWAPQVPKPVVMAVQGIASTLSIELALASDIVIAASDVRFRQLEVGRGILPFGGATLRAPMRLGWGNAMKFLLTGAEFGADEALHIGLSGGRARGPAAAARWNGTSSPRRHHSEFREPRERAHRRGRRQPGCQGASGRATRVGDGQRGRSRGSAEFPRAS